MARKNVVFKYIPTTEIVADALTKALPSVKFSDCRSKMGIEEMKPTVKGGTN